MTKKVSFLSDGFNVYHSLDSLGKMTGASVKWLDLVRLCEGYLQAVRGGLGERVELARVHYFSALAEHLIARKPDVVARHRTYIRALEGTGVRVRLSHFKRKDVRCPACGTAFIRYEEKQTDVAMGLKLVEVLATDECQTAVLVTGDTDLLPAISAARRLFPERKTGVAFPFLRHSRELAKHADYSFKIDQRSLLKAQFPARLSSEISRPAGW
ncbi:MAG TPA: NYN domain-containing protein [Longimicrobium sp.]